MAIQVVHKDNSSKGIDTWDNAGNGIPDMQGRIVSANVVDTHYRAKCNGINGLASISMGRRKSLIRTKL
jgi:hypothetical protein